MKKLPHTGVYVRLKPSRLHGIGVFAVRPIKKGTYIFPEDNDRMIWVPYERIRKLSPSLKELYDDFSIIRDGKYGSPRRFDRLTPSWYLNESRNPNVAADKTYRFYAKRDIKDGEELTVDYKTYSELPRRDFENPLRLRSTKTSNGKAQIRIKARWATVGQSPRRKG